jgi:hypothetical protein
MAGNLQKPMVKTLIASAAVTATGASTAFSIGLADSYTFILNCSAVSGTSPTMDAVMQTSLDGGTTYVNIPWRFTQLTVAATLFLTVRCGLGIGEVGAAGPAAATGGALATATVVDPNFMKLAYTIAATTPSFTFSLTLFAMPRGSTGIS